MRRWCFVFWWVAAASLTSCSVSDLLGYTGFTGPRQLSDDDAFGHLRADRRAAPETDVQAVMSVIDGEADRAAGRASTLDDPASVRLLRSTISPRMVIEEDAFRLVDFEAFGAEFGDAEKSTCSFDIGGAALRGEYLIQGVEKIPVRNQGARGTCAAFAGIGAVEYATLRATGLPTVDLSEQRFYYSSKPECQDASACGCPGCDQGSWYGRGMDASAAASDLDIPLETDCPYNATLGDNDTQTPQTGSCRGGAVKVVEVEAWCGLDDLIDYLHQGYAVPYASPLSGNWRRNDGLITARGITEDDNDLHTGGHAYLIVGYRELPDMPEEGGLCFVVKNSWGEGWGVGGYACQTVAWMRRVTYDGFMSRTQPAVLTVDVRGDLKGGALPDNNEDAEDDSVPSVPDDLDDDDDRLPPIPPDLDPEPEPVPDPPAPDPQAWASTRLLGPESTYYQVEAQTVDDQLFVRGVLRDDRGPTEPLRAVLDGDAIYFQGDEVGVLSDEAITLCAGEFAHLCSVRFRGGDGQLYIQFRDDDLRSVKTSDTSDEKGEWVDVSIGARQYGFFIPNDSEVERSLDLKTFVRLGEGAAARFSLRPDLSDLGALGVRLQGTEVGKLDLLDPSSASLCSGGYQDRCQIVGGSRLSVVPRNSGKR